MANEIRMGGGGGRIIKILVGEGGVKFTLACQKRFSSTVYWNIVGLFSRILSSMPIEIIVALSNFRMVGRGVKKIFGMLKEPYLHPFFYYGYSSFQFVLPFVILPLSNHLMIIIFFTFDNLLNAIWQKKIVLKYMYKVCDIQRIVSMLLFERFIGEGRGAEKIRGKPKESYLCPFVSY